MKNKRSSEKDTLRPEYEFDYSKAVRGKYYSRLIKEGSNVVVLEPDLAKEFKNSAAVNKALRSLLEITETTRRLTKKTAGRGKKAGKQAPRE